MTSNFPELYGSSKVVFIHNGSVWSNIQGTCVTVIPRFVRLYEEMIHNL